MALASAVDRKKAEAAEHTFVIRPPMRQRFPVPAVTRIIKEVLAETLGKEDAKYTADLGKEIADAIKSRMKDELDLPRYKLMVHVVVGENKGEGVRVGTRCLWDATTDRMASHTFQNDSIFAVATAYGTYLY